MIVNGGKASPGRSTVLRRQLGAQLRRLREAAGVSREQAADQIRGSASKISRMELGRVGLKERDVTDLLTLYGVEGEAERQTMLALARQANEPGWWQRYADVVPSWLTPYLGLEAAAARIDTYEIQFIPGLLQTEAYARAVIALGHDVAHGFQLRRRVELRLERQQLLRRPEGPLLRAVIDEAVLHRPIGGTEVMREQVAALLAAAARPNVTIQVIAFERGGYAATGGSFTILRFPDRDISDQVYLEHATGASYLDTAAEVEIYGAEMDRLRAAAEPPDRTAARLAARLRELDD